MFKVIVLCLIHIYYFYDVFSRFLKSENVVTCIIVDGQKQ